MKILKHSTVFSLISVAFTSVAIAAPNVTGNTISWPDNGWYQVQRQHDFSSMCEGGRSCVVEAGTYIVINHSTSERWENVSVQGTDEVAPGATPAAGVAVEGNTITWPDNGWYQVQRVSDFSEICAGGSRCVVTDGVYHVINHTTGQRWESLQVPQGSFDVMASDVPANAGSGFELSGREFQFSANAWFQVQNAENFDTVCEGRVSCSVADGTYIVINHTTGERFESIVVDNDVPQPDQPDQPVQSLGGLDTGLQPVVGTGLPSRNPGNPVSSLQQIVDGVDELRRQFVPSFLPDIDGDGISEAFALLKEPDLTCPTIVYIPSRQMRSFNIDSSSLDGFTRIRNVGFDPEALDVLDCLDDIDIHLKVVGDVDGDGTPDMVTTDHLGPGLLISGAIPIGTVLDVRDSGQYVTRLENLFANALGDLNGDGATELEFGAFSSAFGDSGQSFVLAGGQALPSTLSINNIRDLDLMYDSSVASGELPNFVPIGDFDGDGNDDLLIAANTTGELDRIVYGASGSLSLQDEAESAAVLDSRCGFIDSGCSYEPIGDFNADGFDDLLLVAPLGTDGRVFDGNARNEQTLIAYGAVRDSVRKFTHIIGDHRNSVFGKPIGDVNGDGAVDLSFSCCSTLSSPGEGIRAIVYGTAGKQQDIILMSSLDGGNGVYWEENLPTAPRVPVELDGDGINDLNSRNRYVSGQSIFKQNADPENVFIWRNDEQVEIRWSIPLISQTLVAATRIVVENTTIALLPVENQQQTFNYVLENRLLAAPNGNSDPVMLRIQALDMNGTVIGEVFRLLGQSESNPAAGYETQRAINRSLEETATGQFVDAVDYTLTAQVYSDRLAELFWNASKRFVLVWRDDEVVARTEGNSLLINADEQGSGRYFVTIDYFNAAPDDATPLGETSGTLWRSNVIPLEF